MGHRGARFPGHDTLPIASVEDTVFNALGCLGLNDAVAMTESALRSGRVDRDMLRHAIRANRHARAREALSLVLGQVMSQPEVEARLLFIARRWSVVVQAEIPEVGTVDFLIEGFIIVEIDGYEFHSSRGSFVEDRRRTNAALLSGFPTLRYPPEVVWHHPERIIREVEELLGSWPRQQQRG